jgi:hypothetical protein
MIVVKLMTNEPNVKYENAHRFYIEQNGNLTIKDDVEIIAVHASATWASVAVEKTEYLDKLSPSMVNGVWDNTQHPMFDASGTSFIVGVTNFTAENVYDAIKYNQIPGKKETLTIQLDVSVYNRLDDCNLIDHRQTGPEFNKMKVEINPKASDLRSGVVDSKITNCNGKCVVLRTREF